MTSRFGLAFLAARAPRLVACLVGLWLEVAPAVLDYGGWASDSDRTVGPFVAAISFVSLWELGRPLRWLTLPLGAWLVVAPLILRYGELAPSVNSVVCGLVIVAMAPLDGRVSGAFGGGWRALLHPLEPDAKAAR